MELKSSRTVDTSILERNIYALGLLEALARVEMPFIFKGGTALTLILDEPKRLSTDIDIIVEPGTDVNHYLDEASKIFPFKDVDEDIRIGKNNIEKRHYTFTYDSPAFDTELYILLDILFEKNNYSKTIQKPIDNALLNTEEPYLNVVMPTADCIMGDKLTAFAPHTTGILFGIDKELEIIKQMYDISCLFDVVTNFNDVRTSYLNTVRSEIDYRGGEITVEGALMDTIEAAACIAGRGNYGNDYPLLLKGIKSLPTHIFDGKFNAELAVARACKTMYSAACILKDQPFKKIDDVTVYQKANISKTRFSKLTKLRHFDLVAFSYLVETIQLIDGDNLQL